MINVDDRAVVVIVCVCVFCTSFVYTVVAIFKWQYTPHAPTLIASCIDIFVVSLFRSAFLLEKEFFLVK